jgi:prevent-host-death family protein
MRQVNIHEAKTHLSRLLQQVAAGEEITIASRGVPVARLIPAARPAARRELGIESSRVRVAGDFDAPLPAAVLAGFLGKEKTTKRRRV